MERTYTVQRISEDTPCITIKGKWLRALGIDLGSKLKLVESDNMIVLMKIPEEKLEREQLESEARKLEKKLDAIRRRLALQTSYKQE